MKPRRWMGIAGAILMGIAVALGAVGAHALKNSLQKQGLSAEVMVQRLDRWDVGVRYQMVEATLLILAALTTAHLGSSKTMTAAACLALLAMLLFSGGLYANALTGWTPFIHVVPFGGVCAIASWGLFACGWAKSPK